MTDVLHPDLDTPAPLADVARLTRPQRELRLARLIEQANWIVDQAIAEHCNGKRLVASCVLFSGGNDSTVLAHMMRPRVDYAVHANTTIGIEETRQFVRDTCADWQLPLLERTPPQSYRELVLERGFPGPAMHFKIYQRLKERALRTVRRELVTSSRQERVLYIAGRRRSESTRRQDVPLHERNGSVIWASPLAMWTKLDLNTYRLAMGDVPVNRVAELLGMSGECLCGCFAKPGELDNIRAHFPVAAKEIGQLQRDVLAAGHVGLKSQWGWGWQRSAPRPARSGPLCTSCTDPLLALLDAQAVAS
ncbi:PUA domain (predicted RNA-binding domain) [Mycobacteroides abscessus subsp. abscessus]|uniref:phosphoadenosine phosphosulfate reductase family protein n=1 Tax=Mycobacteroides abscessus TaxID=36809 RepID=UPI00092ADFDF|nr:phosphoadenosine phosphosulfate reductase family protein [Mycobacteroides abscessus]SIL61602.1 PUA domain (predicted RNA-binding domain) [Mycobacteroides abscessus subsp. abscessus]